MEEKPIRDDRKRVWIKYPMKNHNSLVVTIPAGVRQHLNWHQHSPLVIELEDDKMVVRQMDSLKAGGVELPEKTFVRRMKSWKRGPQESNPVTHGFLTEEKKPRSS